MYFLTSAGVRRRGGESEAEQVLGGVAGFVVRVAPEVGVQRARAEEWVDGVNLGERQVLRERRGGLTRQVDRPVGSRALASATPGHLMHSADRGDSAVTKARRERNVQQIVRAVG